MSTVKSVYRRWHYQPRQVVFSAEPYLRAGELVLCTRKIARAEAVAMRSENVTVYLDGHYPVIRSADSYCTEAASWFSAELVELAGVEHCQRLWRWLETAIRHHWQDDRITLLATPASTGRDLWLRSLNPASDGYPVLPMELQQQIRSSAHQGRIELMPAAQPQLPQLYEYDLRLAYLAVARNLPAGKPVQVAEPELSEFAVMQPGRWQVSFTVPRAWKLPGLLPVMAEHGGWHYPVKGTHSTTVDGCELLLAVRHGWKVKAHSALLWSDTCSPFRTMFDRLLRIMAESMRHSELTQRMVRQAVRSIALHTIGSIHGAPHRVSRNGAADEVPVDAELVQVEQDGSVSWVEHQPAAWADTVHPEWSAHIWARARYRVASALIAATPGSVVAVRTDAVYSSERWALPADTGKPGAWVEKRHIIGPMRWPSSHSELLQLRNGGQA